MDSLSRYFRRNSGTVVYLRQKILHHSKVHILWQDMAVRAGMVLTTALGGFALGANNMANVVGVFIDSNVLNR